jgi:hypothetical protein
MSAFCYRNIVKGFIAEEKRGPVSSTGRRGFLGRAAQTNHRRPALDAGLGFSLALERLTRPDAKRRLSLYHGEPVSRPLVGRWVLIGGLSGSGIENQGHFAIPGF